MRRTCYIYTHRYRYTYIYTYVYIHNTYIHTYTHTGTYICIYTSQKQFGCMDFRMSRNFPFCSGGNEAIIVGRRWWQGHHIFYFLSFPSSWGDMEIVLQQFIHSMSTMLYHEANVTLIEFEGCIIKLTFQGPIMQIVWIQ